MSLRQALRSRFKGDKPDSPTSSRKSKDSKSLPLPVAVKEEDETDYKDDDCHSFQSASSLSPCFPSTPDGEFKDLQEKGIFEQQLTQLQEQLVAAMIENQSLRNELEIINKKQSVFEQIKLQLESEKKRNNILEAKIKELDHKKPLHGISKLKKKNTDGAGKSNLSVEPAIDIASDLQEEDVVSIPDGEFEKPAVKSSKSFTMRLYEGILKKVYEVIDDFTEEMDYVHVENTEPDPLTGKKLKENIKRFGTAVKPYYDTVKGIVNLLAWKTPPYTLIVFVVYMYMVWKGWFFQTLLACLTFRLFINILIYRGWNVQFNFIDPGEIDDKDPEESLGLSDKLNLVIEVATKVQNTLGHAADGLEKIKSLLTWRQPDASNQLFLLILTGFISTCIFPGTDLLHVIGLLTGIKLFIIDNIYNKFPRIKKKYDTTHQMWLSLPTDAQYEKKHMKLEIDRYILKHGEVPDSEEVTDEYTSSDDKAFCQLFSLPNSESPLPGWQGGRMCTLINREKSLASAFKSGKLYLTRSFLCFERSKTPSPKNIVIPLANISGLEKAKPYSWLPGGGMAIEVTVTNSDKSFMFGGLMNRDETYNKITEVGMAAQLPWASGLPLDELHMARELAKFNKKSQPHKFKNLSIGMVCDDKEKEN
ncbi:hypothetical protein SNE40_014478 [Patella caerulea]|uniref:GRAM domain-containing protein n=1 Tax=Patella caerulea TaxID=87958 RepID=A0AAN8JGZ7_PATCE